MRSGFFSSYFSSAFIVILKAIPVYAVCTDLGMLLDLIWNYKHPLLVPLCMLLNSDD